MEIRFYKPSDGEKISAFFRKNSPYQRDINFWTWINRVLNEESIVAVAKDNNTVVGHYAVIPRQVSIGNEIFNAGIGLHAVVDSKVRNDLSIFNISSLVYQEAKKQGVDFIYGFPNQNYRLIQEKIERWQMVALFNSFECRSNSLNRSHSNTIVDIENVSLSDFSILYELNNVIEDYNSEELICFKLSASYWLRRYGLHPQNLYEILKVNYNTGTAFFVIKKYIKDNIRYLHIVDFVYDSKSVHFLRPMIVGVFERYHADSDIFSVWKGDCLFESIIKNLGFVPVGFDTFFGIKILSEDAKIMKDQLLNFKNWRLAMGDSDAF